MAPNSATTPVNGKRKRIRKRQKRTIVTQAADDSDSSSSSSSSDSESSSSSSSSSSDSDSSSSSSSDSESETKVNVSKSDEKRHRKRVRKPKQNAGAEATTEEDKTANAVEKFAKLSDPKEDKRLSEATISALSYAKQYAVDKQQWKFNKARQEHLIRHMLSRAPQENANESIEKPEKVTNEEEAEAVAAAEQIHQPSWWPDEWNECVAFYLNTVQGGAKDRLLKRLREAKEQVTPAPIQPLVQESQPLPSTQEAAMSSANSKSVNFADMATVVDAQPSVEEQAEKESDRQRIIFEKKRATALLKFMKQ